MLAALLCSCCGIDFPPQAMNPAVAPVLDVLRLRLQPSARMSPDHAKAFTTSVDLLIQKVVGLAPGAAMTDDLIGADACFQ